MAYTRSEIRSFKGLYLQRNSFTVPDGALEIAKNIVISSDDMMSRCRGFYSYFDVISGTLNNLFEYQGILIAAYEDKLRYYTDIGVAPNETGSEGTITPDTGVTISINQVETRTSRAAQSNGNFFCTTDYGVIKLSSYNSMAFKAGAPQGLDINAGFINGTNNTWFEADNIVGYRIVFGYTDANENLILGAPSEIITISNPLVATKAWARSGGGPYTMTVTSVAHGLTTGQYLLFSAGAGGTPANYEGSFQITVLTADTFSYSVSSDPGAASGTLSYCYAMPVRLESTVPSEITTNQQWFYQVYRSSQQAITIGLFSDFKLIEQRTLTSAEISNLVLFFTDDWAEDLRGAYLYTNENNREGELQANFRPPLCDDITTYKNYTLYGSCTTRHLLNEALVDATLLVAGTSFVELRITNFTRRYTAVSGIGNQTVRATCSSSAGLLITYTSHGFTATGIQSVYISNQAGGSIAEGIYYVIYVGANTFKLASSVANFIAGTAVGYNSETSLLVEGLQTSGATQTLKAWVRASNVVTVTDTTDLSVGMQIYVSAVVGGTLTGGIYVLTAVTASTFSFDSTGANDASGNTLSYNLYQPMFYLSSSATASVRLRDTAQALVKAVNRDPVSLIYAQYSSGLTDVPGRMMFQAKGFGDPIYMRCNSGASEAWALPLPVSFSTGVQVYSRNDELPHGFFTSKQSEPEAVPLVNFYPVGSKDASLIRFHALRDSVIILKEDGVWRLTGDNPLNFNVTLLDGTVEIAAGSSSAVINNTVIFLSADGICMADDNSTQIISRKIDEVIQPILVQPNLNLVTAAVSYESERNYIITTSQPNDATASQVYCYNIMTDAWTTWDSFIFTEAIIGPRNRMYYYRDVDNKIMRERKDQTRTDYCGQNYSTTVTAVAADMKSITLTSSAIEPAEGDILVLSDVINNIIDVTILSATSFTVYFDRTTSLVASDSPILYRGYEAQIKFSPWHAGLLGRMKQFAQMQIHFRDEACTLLDINFSGQTYDGSEITTWNATLGIQGWGEFPWGFDPWGQQNTTALITGTQAAPVCRIYVPRYQQRATYIQPILQNTVAGDPLNIQAVSFDIRLYNERVTR